jgi:acetyl-CoA carboxylase carboxyl transferase subunit alpha
MQELDFEQPIVELERRIEEFRKFSADRGVPLDEELGRLEARRQTLTKEIFSKLTPWQRVQLARHPDRPTTLDYVRLMTEEFIELHGDKYYSDDAAIIAGFATIGEQKLMLIGHEKGKTTKARLHHNFGMAHPDGFRKALGKMKLAGRLNLPVVTLIDTPGAYPGVGAEERGVAHAIAVNLMDMSRLRTPILCFVIGEGGSGGAIGIGLGDRVSILENAYYSVITPEGCSAILWKSAERHQDAAAALKLTAPDLHRLGIVDEVIPEPIGGAHRHPEDTAQALKAIILQQLSEVRRLPIDELLQKRYDKYRSLSFFTEVSEQTAP